MIIRVRPISGGDFEVDIDADETVDTLKAIIISTKPELGEDPDDVKLIHKGKVLSDGAQTIEACGIKANDFLALMAKKKPEAAAPQVAVPQAGGAGAPAQQPGQADMVAALAAMAQQQQAPGAVRGPPPEEMVRELSSMGYPREQVLQALKSAFNNPDRAMEYLLDGHIPPPPPEAGVPQPAVQGQAPAAAGWPAGLLGQQLMTKSGLQPTAQALGSASVVLLYFSAHWCPPCQRFTPMLARAFSALSPGQGHLQVVFVSSDRDPASFAEYYGHMPWLALPFGGPQGQLLGQMFSVRGIPAVVALDGRTGRVLDANARDAMASSNFDLEACCARWGAPFAATAAPAAVAPAPAAPPVRPEPPAAEIDGVAVEAALSRVAELEPPVQEAFYGTLLRVLGNALQNPQDPKFRSLKKGNAALQSKLFGVGDGAAVDLLKLAGFEDGEEAVGLQGAPDGRCTGVRNAVQAHAEAEKMRQLRKERDAKIAEEIEKDKSRAPERRFGGGEDGRHNVGGSRRPQGGGG